AKDLKLISERIELIPAHVWTPHFSLFGAYNQFSKLEDAFGEESKHIYSLETGLSSDPPMNRRVSSLDNLNLLSFSDCHSFWPWRLGREATIFEFDELSYDNVIKAIRTGQGLVGTIEVDPNYGKYHFDGHRKCGVVYDPKESLEHKGICPVCRKPLTVGVATRIEELCDREENYTKSDDKLFLYLIPLHELISKRLSKGINTKQVWEAYNKLIKVFGDEYKILLNASKEELLGVVDEELTNLIIKNRKGGLEVLPGFDGEYGVLVFNEDDKEKNKPKKEEGILHPQRSLSDFA
ncbi:hypothetical protein GOV05_01450, partial [Candidatus Woesearchaeota archaeon]|nr:hypothetical protein [Candidatus Woesearchaeota archaeon]